MLAGEKGAHRDIAVLNAAAALVVAGLAADLAAGVDAAAASIDGGSAAGALDALVRVSQRGRGRRADADHLMAPVLQCPDCGTKHPHRRRVERGRVPLQRAAGAR